MLLMTNSWVKWVWLFALWAMTWTLVGSERMFVCTYADTLYPPKDASFSLGRDVPLLPVPTSKK